MALPLLLAGPILRRVDPNLVSVWLALSEPAKVSLVVYEGIATAANATPFVTSAPEDTWRLGDKLHLALVSARIPETAGKSLQPDTLYSYDLSIIAGGRPHDLASLNMLRDATAEESPDGRAHLALGYQPDVLPSFAPCPSALTDVRILYGSCRLPSCRDPDALAYVDDYIADHVQDPRSRPHQLILGGDQVYADDVDRLMMIGLIELAGVIIGLVNPGDPATQTPVEHLLVDKILKRTDEAGDTDVIDVDNAHLHYAEDTTTIIPPADRLLPVDAATFPPGRRLELTKRAAQLTSGDGHSHVLSFGEFAALYLLVWSNACWTDEIPGATFVPDATTDTAGTTREPLKWTSKLTPKSTIALPSAVFPEFVSEHLYPPPDPLKKADTRSVDEKAKDAAKAEHERQQSLRRSHKIHADFIVGLPKVQRALANVPTYMMFDDHEVTDDLFLSPTWRRRVLTTALGLSLFNNGMLAYALFQDWGNDPLRYDGGLPAELRTRATELFPAGATTGPARVPFERLSVLFGHDQLNEPDGVGGFRAANPPIHWHFTVDAPTHRLISLDNRTRRSYGSVLGPPGNVSVDAQVDQVPKPPLLAGQQVLVVIAPLQVIGPPVIDDLVAPASFRAFDLAIAASDKYNTSDLSERSPTGLRQMFGTHPDAIETWAIDAPVFEQFLEKLSGYERVVLLSGDVHNSSATAMSYWRGRATQPVRFVQFTSSGFKNVMPTMITAVDRSAAFAQQMVRADLGIERLGWERPQDDMVLFPKGKGLGDVVPRMRSRLHDTPVLLPTWGWPPDENTVPPDDPTYDVGKTSRLNPDAPPDWSWRATPLLNRRDNGERPKPIQALEIDADQIDRDLAGNTTVIDGYQAIAARHQHALGHLRNARQILFHGNFAVVRFNQLDGDEIEAVHEVYTAFTDPDQPAAEEPKPEPYMVQAASLGPLVEDPPTRLRTTAIEPRRPDPPSTDG